MLQLPIPIISSKLYPPPLAPDVVNREQLNELGPAVVRSLATLISAPAGYGKSTLASHWLAGTDGNVAWLSLDSTDSDIRRFLAYLIAALRCAFPGCCGETVETLRAPILPSAEEMAGIFCNDFDGLAESVVIVLDDYHQITSSDVHEFIDALLRRPPRGLHLLIVSRRDPPLSLQALRASGTLTEVRIQQLAFSRQESLDFVRRKLGDAISEQAVAKLHEQTEGWPVGLRLAMFALPKGGDADDFVQRIPGDVRAVRAYLIREVLAKCSAQMRDYLLRTAFLDRFSAPLCEAVCRNDDGEIPDISGSEFISRIDEAGLFCIALDSKQEWVRYHHMFQAMLAEQAESDLSEKEIRAVHRRASRWFEDHDLIEESIKHMLKADGPPATANLIIRHRHTIMNNEQWYRLDTWLHLLPQQLLDSRPELLLLRARQLRAAGGREEVQRCLEQAEALLESASLDDAAKNELLGSIESIRCFQFYAMSDGLSAVASAKRALELLPLENLAERGFANIILGGALQMTGRFREARMGLHAALSDPSAIGTQNLTLSTRLLIGLAFIHWMHGDLNELKPLAEETAALGSRMNLLEVLAIAKSFESAIHYQRNELSAVIEILRDLLRGGEIANAEFHAQCMILASLANQAAGNSDEASRIMEDMRAMTRKARNVHLVSIADAFAAELALRQGRMSEARKWAQEYAAEPFTPMYTAVSPALVLAKILVLDDAETSRERAGIAVENLIEYLTRTHNNRFLAEALALRAILRESAEEHELASDDLMAAIKLAQPGRFIRLFVDLGSALGPILNRLQLDEEGLSYVGEILAAFREHFRKGDDDELSAPVSARQVGVDALSKRELQILKLLADRLSNGEIADKLHLSPVTIKRHAANIYQKLGVHSRRQAVAKAAGLGILGKR
jgi:LuxR family maltose regulon positive regulatory protein